jgi:hypothetical protein
MSMLAHVSPLLILGYWGLYFVAFVFAAISMAAYLQRTTLSGIMLFLAVICGLVVVWLGIEDGALRQHNWFSCVTFLPVSFAIFVAVFRPHIPPVFEPLPPPSPDTSGEVCISGQTVVEVSYDESRCHRAIITRDDTGIFRVRTEVWDTSCWNELQTAFWCQRHLGTFTDTLDSARLLASEHLSIECGTKPIANKSEQT